MDFAVLVFLPIYARKQANHNKTLMGRQIIKVLARPTNNAEQFLEQEKDVNLSVNISQNFPWFA